MPNPFKYLNINLTVTSLFKKKKKQAAIIPERLNSFSSQHPECKGHFATLWKWFLEEPKSMEKLLEYL